MVRRRIFLFLGALFIGFSVLLGIRVLQPFVATRLLVTSIATAPVITSAPQQVSSPPVMMPFIRPDDSPVIFTPVPELMPSPVPALNATPTAIAATSTPMLTPQATPPVGGTPTRIRIPSIKLDAPVISIGWVFEVGYPVWDVPDQRAAGWHNTSAKLGVVGNTVLNGHNTSNGEVFRDLYKLTSSAQILIDGEGGQVFTYRVAEMYILPEAGQPLDVRINNARYIAETSDERLTLVTCHPYGSLANRLIVIAFPVAANQAIMTGSE